MQQKNKLICYLVQIEMDKNLLLAEKNKLKRAEITNNVLRDGSYQERDHYLLDQLKYQLLDSLVQLSESAPSAQRADLLATIAKDYPQYITSLASFASEINNLLSQFNTLTLKHSHNTSQSILLALIVRRLTKKKVVLVTDQRKIKKNCMMFECEHQVDTVYYTKDCLQQESVRIIGYRHDLLEGLSETIQKGTIVILDVFGLEPPQYYLHLSRNFPSFQTAFNVIMYHSAYQQREIDQLIHKIQKKNGPFNSIQIELAPPHPLQFQGYEQREALIDAIIFFIKSISHYAQKQDIIVFYPLDQPLQQFLRAFKEKVVKAALKENVNFITGSNQSIDKQRSNIFLAHGNQQLEDWNYNYKKVYMVVDYGFEEVYSFDYELGCHVQAITNQSFLEKLKRITRVGCDRCGSYHYLQTKIWQTNSYLDYYPDISKFLLESIATKEVQLIDLTHWRVVKCLKYLQELNIIKKNQDQTYQVIDQRYFTYAQKGIAPAETKLMLSILDDPQLIDKNKQKYLNLMAMALSSLRNCENLRKVKQSLEGSHIKPYAVWRKSGYLESCLEIITKCELIQLRKHPHNSKSQEFRRKTSKALQSYEVFSKHHNKRNKKFQEMQISDLIQQYSINEPLLLAIRDYIDDFRSAFEFEMIPILLERDAMSKIMLYFAKSSPKSSFALYTGSKATEYFNGKGNIYMHQTCLFNVLNQRPELIKMLRVQEVQGQHKILMANSISKENYIDVFGALPVYERAMTIRAQAHKEQQASEEVIPEVATSFKFQDIPSAVFEQLLKNNGQTIESFEYDNNCHLYLFSQLGQIVINCFKDDIDNKQYVWQNLNIILKKISQGCRYYTKKIHYMGIVQLIIREGAQILEIVDSDQISRCLVTKLPPQIAKEYVEVVLEGFPVKNIEVVEPDQFNLYPSAVIEFYSKKSFQDFLKHYQDNLQNENFFEMKPIKDSEYYSICNKDDQKFRFGETSTTLLFRWYTWKSHCKAQVKFKNPKAAKITLEAFVANPYLDSVAIKLEIDPSNPCLINMSGLKPHTDEIYIAEALKDYGTVESVQILKTPLKQTLGDAQHIGHLLKVGANTDDAVIYQILSMQKKQCGLRQAKVAIPQKHRIRMICERLNKRINLFGQGRLYVEPIYQKQILIPYGCLEIYTELFDQMMEDHQKQRQKIRTEIREDEQAENLYLVLITSVQQTLFFVLSRFRQKLNGVKIDFPTQARNVILNEIGIANFLDMEQKFNCKFIVSAYSGKIKVLAKKQRLPSINKEIQERLANHFFYKVILTSKLYKHYQEHTEVLEHIQKEFQLLLTELEEDNWALLLEGSAINIQKAVNYLHQKDKDKNQQKSSSSKTFLCGICGMQFEESYRLFCSHRFCKECLVVYMRYGLSDMSQFPLKCPELECRQLLNCSDLQFLLDFQDWVKIRTLSINQFLKKNESFTYCLTPGCEQVNRIQKGNVNRVASEFVRCDICKNSYCLQCSNAYHPARTCSEAKMSQDQLLKNYIKDQGVRRCSGKRCKALVVRDTGCYKVQCTRCGICMCFKCPADNMMAFETPTECYDHLNNVHGGFF